MADICVLYLSEDKRALKRLVALLEKRWSVWYAERITHGDWEVAVRDQIRSSDIVVPVISQHATVERTAILRDEIRFAIEQRKPVLVFLTGNGEIPFGLGGLNRTQAIGWDGDETDPGYQELIRKIATCIGPGTVSTTSRLRKLSIGSKRFTLPAFIYSVSSHETQVTPASGLTLLNALAPEAVLVSAYDIWHSHGRRIERESARILGTKSVLVLDSGNYEAYRKQDRYSRNNPGGWRKAYYREVVNRISPDIAFAFDSLINNGRVEQVAENIIRDFHMDLKGIDNDKIVLCPIVHVPSKLPGARGEFAAQLIGEVVRELRPALVAVPERELGSGLRSRALALLCHI